ncbi:class I SAM-dependent methyltransferase [Azohydromonas caseinilytica]|uniref:Class I SAM-dependent methyltransferase n=1 Tax=Azohydromonas caseinilytica TaxID=2728836 RepID=A0A848FD93_9BURK|nr:class I SAM-dependent methyltransferase [Azohydromonas caseinilytica]NML18177.1 class I SAM-dependent methyltransferase [Azohydromonas caseinilytica]
MDNTGFPDAQQTWNQRFDRAEYLFGTAPNAYLASHRNLFVPGRKVLCVADGEGRNSVWLAGRGLQVDAFDLSDVGIAKARELARLKGVHVNFQQADCDARTWQPGAYDYVVAMFVQFANPAMRARLFENIVTTLKPEGHLVLQGYTPRQLDYKTGGPPFAEHLYTEELLAASFKALDIVELRAYDAVIEEGEGHRGMSALIGMVGKKPPL